MPAFRELRRADEIIEYQKKVLSRTGGRSTDDARLFHYTKIDSLMKILSGGYLWLSSPEGMNDILENRLLADAGIDDLVFASFSRSNQNLAMFKMYAEPDGVMLSIPVSEARKMAEQKPRLVKGDNTLGEEVDAELYWIGVCYAEKDTKRITTPNQENHHFGNRLKDLEELAGALKYTGWEFEKEVRLCARKRLNAGERLAVKLPEKVEVVLCPGFNEEKHADELNRLNSFNIDCKESVYDGWINKKDEG